MLGNSYILDSTRILKNKILAKDPNSKIKVNVTAPNSESVWLRGLQKPKYAPDINGKAGWNTFTF